MPKLILPIALMVLGTIKLPGEHDFSDAEAEHAKEQLERLGHSAAPAASELVQLPIVTSHDVLETLATFLDRGEISSAKVAERLGFVSEATKLRIGMKVDETEQAEEPEQPTPLVSAPSPKPEAPNNTLVIPPAVVKELVKAGFILVKPETIQVADDEALLAVKGMTLELLAVVRQIVG